MGKSLKVVAIVSGGKDSCYSMIQCVAKGHEIVALANLRPKNHEGKKITEFPFEILENLPKYLFISGNELDSYMFQTVLFDVKQLIHITKQWICHFFEETLQGQV